MWEWRCWPRPHRARSGGEGLRRQCLVPCHLRTASRLYAACSSSATCWCLVLWLDTVNTIVKGTFQNATWNNSYSLIASIGRTEHELQRQQKIWYKSYESGDPKKTPSRVRVIQGQDHTILCAWERGREEGGRKHLVVEDLARQKKAWSLRGDDEVDRRRLQVLPYEARMTVLYWF
jgi:hypothetical protein